GGGRDLRSLAALGDIKSLLRNLSGGDLVDLVPDGAVAVASNFLEKAKTTQGVRGTPLEGAIQDLQNKLQMLKNGFQFDFPLVDDPAKGVFKLLMGQDAPLIRFTAEYHFPASYTLPMTLDAVPLVPVHPFVRGSLLFNSRLEVGFDTYGLRRFLQSGNP